MESSIVSSAVVPSKTQAMLTSARSGGKTALVAVGTGMAATVGAGLVIWGMKRWTPKAFNAMFTTDPIEVPSKPKSNRRKTE